MCADMAMACALHCLDPVRQDFVRMPHALRKRFGDPKMAPDYADLLEWRDSLFQKHWVK